MERRLRVLVWHVHGSWTTSFVQGPHEYLIPTVDGGGPWGRGRCGRDWPDNARDVPLDHLRAEQPDVVVLQRPAEVDLVERRLGRRLGAELPAVYVEHNTPGGQAAMTRHPLANRDDIPIVHVTHFNELMWDCGLAPTLVIPHGIPDPGHRYTGEMPRITALINDPIRRWRVTGTDLLPTFAEVAPVDVFGMGVGELPKLSTRYTRVTGRGDLETDKLHDEMSRRRVYLHTSRWTSLGLSLLEAMSLGMPVAALACTEAVMAVPPQAGVISTRVSELVRGVREFVHEPDWAVHAGKCAREYVLTNYGIDAFLTGWADLLEEVSR